jgi:multicomponent Na+:H+ antiporter subunit B
VILLATLHLIKTREMQKSRHQVVPLLISLITGGVIVWGTLVLPRFGTADAPIHKHVAPRYLQESIKETNVPNVVTAVLADYRGYDTLGETTVIFTAGIGVMLLLRGSRRRGRPDREDSAS